MKVAVLDLGTNVFNLLLCMFEKDGCRVLCEFKRAARLGAGGLSDGYISEKAFDTASDALSAIMTRIRDFGGADLVLPYATSAVRDARNGRDFAACMNEKFGIEINVISGDREAGFIFRGIMESLPEELKTGGNILMLDIGGGSNEFVISDGIKEQIINVTASTDPTDDPNNPDNPGGDTDPSGTVVTSGLYTYYKFDGDFTDSQNGIDGYGTNSPEFVEGVDVVGQAIKFSRTAFCGIDRSDIPVTGNIVVFTVPSLEHHSRMFRRCGRFCRFSLGNKHRLENCAVIINKADSVSEIFRQQGIHRRSVFRQPFIDQSPALGIDGAFEVSLGIGKPCDFSCYTHIKSP